jgi:MYXO-CTERM domain-containing protein
MADFTFLRLDFGDVTVSTGGGAPEITTSDADREDDSEESGSRAWLAALVGLLFLAVLAVLANRRRD